MALLLAAVAVAAAQTGTVKSFVGTVAGFRPETTEIEIRPDKGEAVIARVTPDTIAQKIAPGATDLKSAETIQVTDVATGDRVLVSIEPGTTNLRRIVVMSAGDIAKRNEADRLDWQKRGIAGLVSSKGANRITVTTRTLTGSVDAVITVDEHTGFRRYAPDSVKFSDAKTSKLAEVSVGDQLRARGEKSADGLAVTAKEVVFGTFLIRAGAVDTIDAASHQLTLKELGTGKTLTVMFTADSQIKLMPSFPAGGMGAGGGMGPGAGAPGGAMRGGAPPAGRAGAPAMAGRGGFPAFDLNQMLERMPASKLEDLKPGATVIVSSTKGAKSDQLTAIMVLGNADMLIRMAAMMSGAGRGGMQAGMGAMGMGQGMGGMTTGDSSGLGNLGLSGILQ